MATPNQIEIERERRRRRASAPPAPSAMPPSMPGAGTGMMARQPPPGLPQIPGSAGAFNPGSLGLPPLDTTGTSAADATAVAMRKRFPGNPLQSPDFYLNTDQGRQILQQKYGGRAAAFPRGYAMREAQEQGGQVGLGRELVGAVADPASMLGRGVAAGLTSLPPGSVDTRYDPATNMLSAVETPPPPIDRGDVFQQEMIRTRGEGIGGQIVRDPATFGGIAAGGPMLGFAKFLAPRLASSPMARAIAQYMIEGELQGITAGASQVGEAAVERGEVSPEELGMAGITAAAGGPIGAATGIPAGGIRRVAGEFTEGTRAQAARRAAMQRAMELVRSKGVTTADGIRLTPAQVIAKEFPEERELAALLGGVEGQIETSPVFQDVPMRGRFQNEALARQRLAQETGALGTQRQVSLEEPSATFGPAGLGRSGEAFQEAAEEVKTKLGDEFGGAMREEGPGRPVVSKVHEPERNRRMEAMRKAGFQEPQVQAFIRVMDADERNYLDGTWTVSDLPLSPEQRSAQRRETLFQSEVAGTIPEDPRGVEFGFETAPGEGVEVKPGQVHADLVKPIHGPDGKNLILKALGIAHDAPTEGFGTWNRKANPNTRYFIPKKNLSPAQLDKLAKDLHVSAEMIRDLYDQDAVGFYEPMPSRGAASSNLIRLDFGRPLDGVETEDLVEAIARQSGDQVIDVIPYRRGADILNRTAIPTQDLLKIVEEAANKSKWLPDGELRYGTAKSSLVERAHGKGIRNDYERETNDGGRLFGRLLPVLRNRVEKVRGPSQEISVAAAPAPAPAEAAGARGVPPELQRPGGIGPRPGGAGEPGAAGAASRLDFDRIRAREPDAVRVLYKNLGLDSDPARNTLEDHKIYGLDAITKGSLEETDKALAAWLQKIGWNYKIFGNKYGPPNFKEFSYPNRYAWIFDPAPGPGSFKDEPYTKLWRVTHEVAHGLTDPRLTERFGGQGKRQGALGVETEFNGKKVPPLSLADALRAIEWEHETFARQRRILKDDFGIEISDEEFYKENALNMADAVHRVLTGEFSDPDQLGILPRGVHPTAVLRSANKALRDAAKEMNLDMSEAFEKAPGEIAEGFREGALRRQKYSIQKTPLGGEREFRPEFDVLDKALREGDEAVDSRITKAAKLPEYFTFGGTKFHVFKRSNKAGLVEVRGEAAGKNFEFDPADDVHIDKYQGRSTEREPYSPELFQTEEGGVKGGYRPKTGEVILYPDADVSTGWHENAHKVLDRLLSRESKQSFANLYAEETSRQAFTKAGNPTREFQEWFAEMGETWLAKGEGVGKIPGINDAIEKLHKAVKQLPHLSPEALAKKGISPEAAELLREYFSPKRIAASLKTSVSKEGTGLTRRILSTLDQKFGYKPELGPMGAKAGRQALEAVNKILKDLGNVRTFEQMLNLKSQLQTEYLNGLKGNIFDRGRDDVLFDALIDDVEAELVYTLRRQVPGDIADGIEGALKGARSSYRAIKEIIEASRHGMSKDFTKETFEAARAASGLWKSEKTTTIIRAALKLQKLRPDLGDKIGRTLADAIWDGLMANSIVKGSSKESVGQFSAAALSTNLEQMPDAVLSFLVKNPTDLRRFAKDFARSNQGTAYRINPSGTSMALAAQKELEEKARGIPILKFFKDAKDAGKWRPRVEAYYRGEALPFDYPGSEAGAKLIGFLAGIIDVTGKVKPVLRTGAEFAEDVGQQKRRERQEGER
jgi:hypothetical protein